MTEADDRPAGNLENQPEPAGSPPRDLDFCPRCGTPVRQVIWGQTNCPQCGLHFECC